MSTESTPTPEVRSDLPRCRICGAQAHWLGDHLAEIHSLGIEDYIKMFPGAPTASAALESEWKRVAGESRVRRVLPPAINELFVDFAGVKARVNHDVPEDDCLPLPPHYRVPENGPLAEKIKKAAVALASGRGMYVYGLPGCGKDALFHAWCAMTRTPSVIFNIEPGADVRAWFFSRSFSNEGTTWEQGELLRLLVEGYTTSTGRKIPYTILVSDFDRATKAQAEALRLVTDSISGRVKGAGGVTHRVFPGTQIVMTGNTMGGGDQRGRCVSSNPIDASILDRLGPKFKFSGMDWKDEEPIVRAKFPLLVQRTPGVFASVGAATAALRAAVEKDELYAEFSHRALCTWLQQTEDIVRVTGKVPSDLLKQSAEVIVDGMPDNDTRDAAIKLIDANIKGGVLDTGDTSHIDSSRPLDTRFK